MSFFLERINMAGLLCHRNKDMKKKSVTSARSSEESVQLRTRNGSGSNSSNAESPRNSKNGSQSNFTNNRVQRQRSFKSAENENVRRSRGQSDEYELSEDLRGKQVEMLERKYGGSICARRAARTIQRAYRQYCMNRNFEKLRSNFGERRVSKRLSELGRSSTVWGDRISGDLRLIMGGTMVQSSEGKPTETFQSVRKRISEIEAAKLADHQRLLHQQSLDTTVKLHVDSSAHRSRNLHKDRRKLERSMHIDLCEGQDNRKDGSRSKSDQCISEETNNNRNSYPEMNDSSASDSPQATPVESAVDLHSLDFENLLESRETDILTDSFHSDSLHSDGSQEAGSSAPHTPHTPHRYLGPNLGSDVDLTGDHHKPHPFPTDIYTGQYSESPSDTASVLSDIQIRVEQASPEDRPADNVQHLHSHHGKKSGIIYTNSEPGLLHYNSDVKLRGVKHGPPETPQKPYGQGLRGPSASPIWKRKSALGSTNSGANIKVEDLKRMSNISETSEPDSVDGQCYSSSPSSENISSENISIGSLGSENSISYQRKIRHSITPEQQHNTPKFGDKVRKRLYRIGLNLFNKKPEKGIYFLVENSFIDPSSKSISRFLISRKGLSKQMIGEYLGNLQNPFNQEVLEFFSDEIDLSGLSVDVALRKFQSYFRMPGEAQKIERLMEAFAQRFCMCNPDQLKQFKSEDTIFLLAFAIIMLNTDLHNSNIKPERKMKLEDFIKNLRGIDNGEDVDRDILVGIYERIKGQEFRPGVDHVSQVLKVEQSIVGKKPQLALPHRRLVCYCRLYEVHDPNKKERVGSHQREVFLFNDILLITKIFSKKKTGITYSFKQSFQLYGMQVYLFHTPYYQFGVRLTNNIDGKILITFNARNDHDRQKFVDDLKEAILETNGMETIRIEEELNKHRSTQRNKDKHNYVNDDSRVMGYDLLKPSDPVVNRLSAPECGLKKTNSLIDLSEASQGMRRGSAGSLDSGMVSGSTGSTGSAHSQEDPPLPTVATPKGASLVVTPKHGVTKKLSSKTQHPNVRHSIGKSPGRVPGTDV
ncbi:IQ motif and SEC7 domain-containing protein 1-like isoform X3 [Liolophura sinensis]|uniref:IQ motif and SEC7 domain-containing protein 1-like isoform X3 n=1 Tax=Liolophura sinensis TaxID=3198878 RepID=UPI003158B0CF